MTPSFPYEKCYNCEGFTQEPHKSQQILKCTLAQKDRILKDIDCPAYCKVAAAAYQKFKIRGNKWLGKIPVGRSEFKILSSANSCPLTHKVCRFANKGRCYHQNKKKLIHQVVKVKLEQGGHDERLIAPMATNLPHCPKDKPVPSGKRDSFRYK